MERRAWDVCVLGAGPAGYAAAMRAHDLGKRVLLVEKGRVGGAGIHAGALSSKTLWHLSNDYANVLRTDRGYSVQGAEVSYQRVIDCVKSAVDERRGILEKQLDILSKPTPNGGEVTIARGTARFTSPSTVEIQKADGGVDLVEADNFVVATGSSPRKPDNIEIDGHIVVTSDQIESFPEFPKSLVIVGAGVIGCEYATMFAQFGKTKVYMIDRAPRILPFEDEDVAHEVATSLQAMGVTIHHSSKLESLAVKDGKVEYVITNAEGKRETIVVERALISIGRVPNSKNLNLEAAGVGIDKGGGLVVKDTQTANPKVWAAGDATMDLALVNIAELEGRYAVDKMYGLSPREIRYEALSTIMFLAPEVASVGINETKAKEKSTPYVAGVVANRLVSRNVAMRETRGFVKLLASPDSKKLLGLRVVGAQASSTIQGVAFLIDMGATLDDIERCVHPHPAIPEAVQECARMLLGRSVMKPEVFGGEGLLRRVEA